MSAPDTVTRSVLHARLAERAALVRLQAVHLIAKVGHYASAFSRAEILAAPYDGVMRLRRGEPPWPDGLRFGRGHAPVGLYPILADLDFFHVSRLNECTGMGNRSATTPP